MPLEARLVTEDLNHLIDPKEFITIVEKERGESYLRTVKQALEKMGLGSYGNELAAAVVLEQDAGIRARQIFRHMPSWGKIKKLPDEFFEAGEYRTFLLALGTLRLYRNIADIVFEVVGKLTGVPDLQTQLSGFFDKRSRMWHDMRLQSQFEMEKQFFEDVEPYELGIPPQEFAQRIPESVTGTIMSDHKQIIAILQPYADTYKMAKDELLDELATDLQSNNNFSEEEKTNTTELVRMDVFRLEYALFTGVTRYSYLHDSRFLGNNSTGFA